MTKSEMILPGLNALMSEIPNMMGFVPADSLVLIGFQDFGTRTAVIFTLRIDLPAAEHRPEAADYLREVVQDKAADAVVAAVIGGDRDEQWLLADHLGTAFGSQGIELHAMWTAELRAGQNWFCYHDDDCHGTVYDTSASQLAAATAVAGFRVWESREEMAAIIAAAPEAERDDWARQLQDWRERSGRTGGSLREHSAPVFTALGQIRAGEQLSTEQAVAALGALARPLVRDLMLIRQEPDAEHLWTILLRHAPDTEVEAPAVLLAAATHLHGDGAMADIALQRARDAATPEPPSDLVVMLDRMLKFAPRHMRTVLDELAADPAFELS